MYCWSVDWQMLFNTDKCKTLHFGYNNVNNEYMLGNEIIKSCDEERDLGVIISRTLKSSSQCVAAAKSANRILGMISRTLIRIVKLCLNCISRLVDQNSNTVYRHGDLTCERVLICWKGTKKSHTADD